MWRIESGCKGSRRAARMMRGTRSRQKAWWMDPRTHSKFYKLLGRNSSGWTREKELATYESLDIVERLDYGYLRSYLLGNADVHAADILF